MYGAVLCMVLIEDLNFLLYLAATIGVIFYTIGIKKMFADGDLEALRWCIPGFFMLNWVLGLAYLISFAGLTGIYVISRRILKIPPNTAGYTLIAGSFVICAALGLGF